MQLAHIDFDRLSVSALNMRHGKKPPEIGDILPSIRKRGVLIPLVVRPNGEPESFEILAGRRRYYAVKAIFEDQGTVTPLPCAVMEPGDDAAAVEASLLENIARLEPDEMTQHEAFVRLTKEGRSIAEIAATFGVTERLVEQRLALGNLLPKIKDAYREELIDGESIRYLTMASKAQQKEWLALFTDPEKQAPEGRQLKQWLFGGQSISTKVALFPLEDYGAPVVSDLFDEVAYFGDTELFWQKQNEAIAKKREEYLAAHWSDVVILEPGQRFHQWEHEKTPKRRGGKVFILVSPSGEVEIFEGYLSRQEARKREKPAKESRVAALPSQQSPQGR